MNLTTSILDRFPHRDINAMVPADWERALAFVAKYYGWSRADTWGCTLSELRWWYEQMVSLEAQPE